MLQKILIAIEVIIGLLLAFRGNGVLIIIFLILLLNIIILKYIIKDAEEDLSAVMHLAESKEKREE